jgi:metal-responsive CopG/Arc/MetJ family transcriptional regulator
MAEPKKREFKPKVETRLRRDEFRKLDDLATLEKKSKSEVVREAVLWYLANQEQIKNEPRETAIALEIEGMTNRICAMLARQGRQIATVFELTHASMSQTPEGEAAFEAAVATANQKQNRSVTKDEREVVDAMKKKVKGK